MVLVNNAARHKNHSVVKKNLLFQVLVIEDLMCVPYVTQMSRT